MHSTLTFLLFLALAVDGALEINKACAAQAGCFSGDTTGYPVTITQPGSYILTSNLDVGTFATSAIRIDVDDVTNDLNGFTVRFTFSGGPAAEGIDAEIRDGITIKNGNVRGFEGACISAQHNATVTNVQVSGCGDNGLNVGSRARVRDVKAFENGGSGINTNRVGVITGNTVYLNGGHGIVAGSGMVVSGNAVSENVVNGILADGGSIVERNAVSGNGSYGLRLEASDAYRGNVITNNTVAPVLGGANRGENYCEGTGVASSLCP